MDYRFRISQDELEYAYENAIGRMKVNPDFAEKQNSIIQKCPHFDSEKDALEAAIKLEKKNPYTCQIWAKVEKVDDIYRIHDYWIVAGDSKIKTAADYIGMVQMYDETRLQNIIYNDVKIDDVIAYY